MTPPFTMFQLQLKHVLETPFNMTAFLGGEYGEPGDDLRNEAYYEQRGTALRLAAYYGHRECVEILCCAEISLGYFEAGE